MHAVSNLDNTHHYSGALESAPVAEPFGQARALPPELMLMMAVMESHLAESQGLRLDIDQTFEKLEDLRNKIQKAIEKARDAEDDGGFWDSISNVFGNDIAKIAGIVASAAMIASTCGAAGPIVAAAAVGLMGAGYAGEKLGLDSDVCAALAIAGGLAGAVGGNFVGASGVWSTVATTANVTEAAATGVGAGTHIVAANYHADATEHRARARFGRGQESLTEDEADELISIMSELAAKDRSLVELISNIQSTEHEGIETVVHRIGA